MTWVLVIFLAAAVMAALIFAFRLPRGAVYAAACALLLGLAGYAAQGRPGLAAAPKSGDEAARPEASIYIEGRARISNSGIPTTNRWIVISDGLARNGRYADAAEVLRGALDADPKDAEAWLALGNALVAHADNVLTPPALYAYRRAIAAAPDAPGARFFLGLAYAREGKLKESRALWLDALSDGPQDAPWRLPLAEQIVQLDGLIRQQAMPPAPAPGPAPGPAAGAQPSP